MDPLVEFLKESKELIDASTSSSSNNTPIHIILGNESCDLDSMVSSIALGYYLYQLSNKATYKKMVVPILNLPQKQFALRTENCYLCRELGINQSFLVFKSDLNLKKLKEKSLLTVSLVDHHVLTSEDAYLAECVTEIYDHRPIDPNSNWDKSKVKIVIDQVGSCATLIARQIQQSNNLLCNSLALLLYNVIMYDTIAFNSEAKKFKELDIEVSKKLAEQFNILDNPKNIFDKLWRARNDISHLTPYQLLLKDVKFVDKLPIAVVPMLVKDYLKLRNVIQDMNNFCKEKCTSVLILIGLSVVGQDVYRDIAVYNGGLDKDLVNKIIKTLKSAETIKGYDLELEEIPFDLDNVMYFVQKNVKLTRKHILPLITDAIANMK